MSSSALEKFTGQCVCGAVRYEALVPIADGLPPQALCHCLYCKRLSGACFSRVIAVPLNSLTVVSGEPKTYVYQQRPDKPTPFKENPTSYFCGNCGCAVFSENKVREGMAFIKVGTLDRQAEFTKVYAQVNCENESTWLADAIQAKENRWATNPVPM